MASAPSHFALPGWKPGSKSGLARRGLMLVLSSPSGAGKTTLSRKLLELDDRITMSVSVTTRPPRPGEVPGKDYFFVGEDEFAQLRDNGELLEHATVFGNLYGTPRRAVEEALSAGRDVLFDIDWQGTQQLDQSAEQDLVKVFLLPPSAADLEKRLRTRAQDSDDVVRQRMSKASDEISHFTEYDYILINQDIDDSLAKLTAILNAERLKRRRLTGLASFVQGLRDAL
ncbi:guanylate kinase [Aquabacter sp. CN5-332]|uniref:guanylate kinase n=1 Tax=Aquabacter sp. CN5-332 TaxID=3156608 RepID=UPI0032B5F582